MKKISQEQNKILSFYKQLFNYKSLLLFPPISENTIEPFWTMGFSSDAPFTRARDIDWLNFYHEVLRRDPSGDNSNIDRFFSYYQIDLLYPIRFKNELYGFMALGTHGRKPSHLEEQIALIILNYLGSLWHNQELLDDIRESAVQTERLLSEISTLLEVSQAIESGGNIQQLLEMIMEKCMKVISVEAVSLMLLTSGRKDLEFRVALGPKGKDVKPYRIKMGQGIAGTVARSGEALVINDAYKDERFDATFDKRSGFKTNSILCVPLNYRKRVIGVVQALNRLDGKYFTEHDLRTFKIFASQAALAVENARLFVKAIKQEKLESQIAVASEIQRLIVPEKLPEIRGFELSGSYIPSQGIGGDFYTVLPVNETETIFCIADVSGKSVPGALLVSTMHASLKAYLEFTTDLKLIMQKLNDLIINLSTSDRFITLFLGKYDSQNEMFHYINAGHNPQYLIRKPSEIYNLKSTGLCIGIMPFEYSLTSIELKKQDLLVFYTDGIVEARNKSKKVFGDERFIELLKTLSDKPCSELQTTIMDTVETFCKGVPVQDDLTLLVVRKK